MGWDNPKGEKLDGGLYKFKMAELREKSPEMDWEDVTVPNVVNADGVDEKNRGGGDARKEFP